jgi:hypothetical protein
VDREIARLFALQNSINIRCGTPKLALFTTDSVMLGVSAQKSEDSPIKPDKLCAKYAAWDPLRPARMATDRPSEFCPLKAIRAGLGRPWDRCAIHPRRWARLRGYAWASPLPSARLHGWREEADGAYAWNIRSNCARL